MNKASGNILAFAAALLAASACAWAWIDTRPPVGAIEYRPDQAIALHGSAETFDRDAPVLLRDIIPGDPNRRLGPDVSALTVIRGYFHAGHAQGDGQEQANARMARVQLWGWLDSDGDGAATVNDAKVADRAKRTTRWVKLWEAAPDGSDPNLPQVDVVGWQVDAGATIPTSTWQGDIFQSKGSVAVKAGESWLLLVRVIDINGNTNLMDALGGTEAWDNGDTSDGVGTDVPGDKYLDANGNTPGAADARVADDAVVWVYRPAK